VGVLAQLVPPLTDEDEGRLPGELRPLRRQLLDDRSVIERDNVLLYHFDVFLALP
jgi:hypothetical protein